MDTSITTKDEKIKTIYEDVLQLQRDIKDSLETEVEYSQIMTYLSKVTTALSTIRVNLIVGLLPVTENSNISKE